MFDVQDAMEGVVDLWLSLVCGFVAWRSVGEGGRRGLEGGRGGWKRG